jgi:hypothetical protein
MAYQLMGNNVEVQPFRLMVKIIFTRMICLTDRVNQPPEWQFLRRSAMVTPSNTPS